MEKLAIIVGAVVTIFISAAVLMPPHSGRKGEVGAPSVPPIGLPGCETRCGHESVPFPFSLGPERCYYMPEFKLSCVDYGDGQPPRLLLGTLEVHDISLENGTMILVGYDPGNE